MSKAEVANVPAVMSNRVATNSRAGDRLPAHASTDAPVRSAVKRHLLT